MPLLAGVTDHMKRWILSEEEDVRAKILSPELVAKLETINVELSENLAEFVFQASGNTGAIINMPDFHILCGRRSLALQLLSEHDEAMGLLADADDEASNAG